MVALLVACWDCGAPLFGAFLAPGHSIACGGCGAVNTIVVVPPPPIVDRDIRCPTCHKLIVRRAGRPWSYECARCGTPNARDA